MFLTHNILKCKIFFNWYIINDNNVFDLKFCNNGLLIKTQCFELNDLEYKHPISKSDK